MCKAGPTTTQNTSGTGVTNANVSQQQQQQGTGTSATSANPAAMAAYLNLLGSAQQTAQTPFQPYGGQFVAGFTPEQQAAEANINANAGFAQPYIQQGATYAQQAATPISGQDISQYLNPYTQQVVNATQAQFANANAEQQSSLLGNAASQGALGGDRTAVAQSELARQQNLAQNPVIAGLYSQGFNTALSAAQAQQQQEANAAYSLGNLGVSGQNAALQGANAQFGVGSAEQQTQQANLNAQYNQFLMQQAYPFQTQQWLAGITGGIAPLLGGTSQTGQTGATSGQSTLANQSSQLGFGQQILPAPNPLNSILGAGVTAAAAFAKRGGRVAGFAEGGDIGGSPYGGISGYVPRMAAAAQGVGLPPPPTVSGQPLNLSTAGFGAIASPPQMSFGKPQEEQSFSDSMKNLDVFKKAGSGLKGVTDKVSGWFSPATPTPTAMSHDPAFDSARGGPVRQAGFGTGSMMVRGYDEGGDVGDTFAERYGAVGDNFDDRFNAGFAAPATTYNRPDVEPSEPVPSPRPRPDVAPETAYAQADESELRGPADVAPPPPAEAPRRGLFGLPALSENARLGLLAAGLGMMSSRSHYLGEAIGQGGLAGLHTYVGQQEFGQKLSVQQEAQKLREAIMKQTQAHQQTMETQGQQRLDLERNKPFRIGTDPETGMDRLAIRGPNGEIIPIDSATGQPVKAGASPAATPSTQQSAAPAEGEGVIPANARVVEGGAFDYTKDAPYLEKGMDVPEPKPLMNKTPEVFKQDAEYYMRTKKLPFPVRSVRNNPVAFQQQQYNDAVKNYVGALAQSRGMSADKMADLWQAAPQKFMFIRGQGGQQVVSLGTAVRHLDTLKQLVDAWKEGGAGNWQTWNRLTSAVRRNFGDAAVTNIDAAAHIIGPEIIKSLGVAGAGSEGERNSAASQFTTTKGVDQIFGAINTTQKLLGGQLEGKQRQALKLGLDEKDFKDLVGEREYGLLSNIDKGGGQTAAPAQGAPAKPPSVTQRGHTYYLQPDGSYK